MPTYEYVCRDCGHQWDAFQSIKAAPLKLCEKCGHETAQRLVTGGGGFILKGGGWYSDLYASPKTKNGKEASGSGSGNGNGSSASSSAKTETKAEPKSEAKGTASSAPPAPAAKT